MEVGTHSAWVWDVVASYGLEVLVANPRPDGRAEATETEKLIGSMQISWLKWGEWTPQSLFQIEHRSVEVRQDLLVVAAGDAAVPSLVRVAPCKGRAVPIEEAADIGSFLEVLE